MAIPGYRILRKIRQGGMSTVYLAIQKSVDREVAIKVMSPSLSRDPGFGSRFYREAKIVGQLSHPNIVSIYDVGNHKQYNYIAMDYLPGAPLPEKIQSGLTTQESLKVLKEMASALEYAHSKGYVHRDIKPDNILFRADGSSVLCDFGIAKSARQDIKMTQAGTVMGTPHYMSPEQAQGDDVDGRSDIYSLGVVFFEMLMGFVPYPGDDPVSVAVKHMSAPVPKLSSAHKLCQPIIDRCLAKKPVQRFQSGQELIDAIEKIEANLSSNRSSYLTQSQSTSVQIAGLLQALLNRTASALMLSVKRLFGRKLGFSGKTVQLSEQHYEALDKFVLDDETLADQKLFSDTGPIPIVDSQLAKKKSAWPVVTILILLGLGAAYFFAPIKLATEPSTTTDSAKITPSENTLESAEQTPTTSDASLANKKQSTPIEPERFALTINTNPSQATVRILNIKPVFTQGMKLEPGPYHIEVSAKDYFKRRLWVSITDSDLTRTIKLKPTRRLLPAGTVVNDPLPGGFKTPDMVVLPVEPVDTGDYKLSPATPIAISVNEVTYEDFDIFARATGRALPDDFGWGRKNKPVVGISFEDAKAYTEWLSTTTKQRYRLPSSTEWEYAARGGTSTDYWWGTASAEKKSNCRRGCDSKWSKLFGSSTAPVGSFKANAFGVHDTAGNVAEWLECFQLDDNSSCENVVVAGGSHQDSAQNIKVTSRKAIPASGNKSVGIRLVLDL